MQVQHLNIGIILLGFGIFGFGVFAMITEPTRLATPTLSYGLIAGGTTLVGIGVWNLRRLHRGEKLVDERISTLSEKAGYRSFQLTMLLEGLLTALFGITAVRIDVFAVTGGLLTITAATYLVFYLWNRRQM